MDPKALFKISYGLYVLTAREMGKDNGCIINTVMQVANDPDRIAISVLKSNLTHDMIAHTGAFCVSALTQEAPFSLFQRFGMVSGRKTNKFAGFPYVDRTPSTQFYLTSYANMYLTAVVTQEIDLGTHTMFIAEITDSAVLSDAPSCTYTYYQENIKPKPKKKEVTQWECTVCGYVYEGEEVPDDYICPLCKHGKEDFVKL